MGGSGFGVGSFCTWKEPTPGLRWRNRRNPPRLLQDPGASDSSVFAPAAAPTPEQRFARPKSTYMGIGGPS